MSARWLLMVALVGLLGCSQNRPCVCDRCPYRVAQAQPVEVLPQPILQASYSPVLLFDRVPARYSATDFAYRSDWPSTASYYAPGEAIYYKSWFYDYQGPGDDAFNGPYRQFETRRYGTGYR